MLFKQSKNFLPKKRAKGVAPKTHLFEHKLLKLEGFKKLKGVLRLPQLRRGIFGLIILGYLAGYQPTFAIPPVKKAVVRAEFSQEQNVGIAKLSQPFNLPHPGYISNRYATWHKAVDIATGLGMPVHPVAPGKIVEVNFGWFGLGNYAVVEHEQGYRSLYAHMGRVFVKKDAQVEVSSILGEVGLTGRTTGPHTHLELTHNGQLIDPETVLPTLANYPNPEAASGRR